MIKRFVVTGSLAYDHIMSMPGQFSDHIMPDKIHMLNVSFIMQDFRKEFGGTAGNIAYSSALLHTPVLLAATAGNDFSPYNSHLKKTKYLDSTGVKICSDTPTAQGFVITDRNDNQIWGFYQGAMQYAATLDLISFLKPADFLIIAPNDPTAVVSYVNLAIKTKTPYLFDPAFNIPHFKIEDFRTAINHAAIVIGNDYEIELIKRRLDLKDLPQNHQIWITTLGSKGSLITHGSETLTIPPVSPLQNVDPTGAGDAYRAGFLAGFFRNLPLDICGKLGSLSAVYTVEHYGTQTHRFTLSEFTRRFKDNFSLDLKSF